LPSTPFFPYPSMFWQSKSCLRRFMGRVMMDWEERGKLRLCPLLIYVVCLPAPGRTWGKSATTCSIC
jgi:hypothetical protein